MTASGNEGIPGVHIYIYVRLKNSDKSLDETLEDIIIRSALIEKLKEAVAQSDLADRIVVKDGKGWDLESSVEVTEMRQDDGTQPITEFAIEIIDERIGDKGKAVWRFGYSTTYKRRPTSDAHWMLETGDSWTFTRGQWEFMFCFLY